jgi:hypothetical protein
MGQCFAKPSVDEAYLAPEVLKGLENIDLAKLKKLIQKGHLAPCYAGVEEADEEVGTVCVLLRLSLTYIYVATTAAGGVPYLLFELSCVEYIRLLHTAHMHGVHPEGMPLFRESTVHRTVAPVTYANHTPGPGVHHGPMALPVLQDAGLHSQGESHPCLDYAQLQPHSAA